ncbi:MAG: helix-turn-helix transcriptional regulator [Candidatus Azotimanducaceae bacterium WSBS_2022_MAG_OTU7]
MKSDKRKKIEKSGWKVGSTDEFLGLTKEESAYIEMKLTLSNALKNERTKRKISQVELAKMISSSQSRVAKMEAEDPSVSVDLLVRSLLALGVSRNQIAKSVAA